VNLKLILPRKTKDLVTLKFAGLKPSEFDAVNPENRYVRMYIGLEEAHSLKKDIGQALTKI
jgi:cystathionine beta-lyase/cystathionine gamma-synthase